MTSPVAGATPVTTITSTSEYTGAVAWSPNDATFDYSTTYTATITLTAASGYTFSGGFANTSDIAGFTVNTIAPTWVSNNGATLVFTVTFSATGTAPTPPVITTSSGALTGGTVGAAYNVTLTATNSPTAWAVSSGSLPAGLTLNTTTGVIAGTPTTFSATPYSFNVTATNGDGTSAPVSFTITIGKGTQNAPTGLIKSDETAAGAGDGTISGLTTAMEYSSNNGHSYTSCADTSLAALTPGTYLVRYAATADYNASPDMQVVIGAYNAPLAFATSTAYDIPASTVGTAIAPIDVSGGASGGTAPYSFGAIGLPAGIRINTSTGVISGAPTMAALAGTATITVTDNSGATDSITINYGAVSPAPVPLTFTGSSSYDIPASTVGTAITSIDVSGGVSGGTLPYTFTSSTLPAGISITTAGVISGTPTTTGSAGTATITVTDNSGATDSITINYGAITAASTGTAPAITTTTLASGTINTAYSQTLAATGTTPITWSITSGSLPAGLSLNASSGVISGTPTAIGTANFTVQAANGTAPNATQALSITIAPAGVTTFTITATAGSGGIISPSGSVPVTLGANQTFTITPNSYYSISYVTVDGTNIGAVSSYTFSNVTANHTISATFYYSYSSGGSGGSGGYYPPATTNPPTTPAPTPTPIPGGNGSTVTTPDGQPPVKNSDGSMTLPGGGTITTQGGSIIIVPPGTKIDKNGDIIIPNGNSGGSVVVNGKGTHVEPGMTIDLEDGEIPLGGVNIYWNNPFVDISEDDWFYNDVMYVYTRGLMNGTDTDAYSPQTALTRGMIVTILYRYAGLPNVSGLDNPFSDVALGKYYADAVKWAAENGIVSGYGNGLFGPEDSVTREQLVTILYRFAQAMGMKLPVTRTYTGFKDEADIANYALEAIKRFFEAGFINGKGNEIIDPKGTATRAEVAAILHRFLDAVEEETPGEPTTGE